MNRVFAAAGGRRLPLPTGEVNVKPGPRRWHSFRVSPAEGPAGDETSEFLPPPNNPRTRRSSFSRPRTARGRNFRFSPHPDPVANKFFDFLPGPSQAAGVLSDFPPALSQAAGAFSDFLLAPYQAAGALVDFLPPGFQAVRGRGDFPAAPFERGSGGRGDRPPTIWRTRAPVVLLTAGRCRRNSSTPPQGRWLNRFRVPNGSATAWPDLFRVRNASATGWPGRSRVRDLSATRWPIRFRVHDDEAHAPGRPSRPRSDVLSRRERLPAASINVPSPPGPGSGAAHSTHGVAVFAVVRVVVSPPDPHPDPLPEGEGATSLPRDKRPVFNTL